jgi:DNA-directed RNA polymerase I, II, and III subunit RPABC5
MIIPIKCFTCGNVLADKYRFFQNEVRKMKKQELEESSDSQVNMNKVTYFTKNKMTKTHEGIVLDNLRLTNVCCRRHMLTHVDIE